MCSWSLVFERCACMFSPHMLTLLVSISVGRQSSQLWKASTASEKELKIFHGSSLV